MLRKGSKSLSPFPKSFPSMSGKTSSITGASVLSSAIRRHTPAVVCRLAFHALVAETSVPSLLPGRKDEKQGHEEQEQNDAVEGRKQ